MKILFVHIDHSPGVNDWYNDIVSQAGGSLDVRSFCITLSPPGPRLSWPELDRKWKQRDKALLEIYAKLLEESSSCDVLLLYNGANLHPEFLQKLSTFNVYCCFDDPESSQDLSEPVATAFDAVFYGNVASRFQYEHWGCKRLAWLPIFTAPRDIPSQQEGMRLLSADRDIETCFIGEKNCYRNQRLDMLADAFAGAKLHGRGWPNGHIAGPELMDLYRRSQIGWNVHNTTGPINRRMFALPAFGVLQLCDNKTGLGQVFRLNEEVIGFDTIPEAIELTRYYLDNPAEQRKIAEKGFRRFWREYHASAIWERIERQIDAWIDDSGSCPVAIEEPQDKGLSLTRSYGRKILAAACDVKRKIAAMAYDNRGIAAIEAPLVVNINERAYLEEDLPFYHENPEMKGVNMAKDRLAAGEPFEWPNMVALNWATTALIRDAKKIIEIGSGTGPFANYSAIDPSREIFCFEEDDFARGWAEKNRSYPNVHYEKYIPESFLDKFDLLVSLDVVEHVADMRGFLTSCASWAPRAIFSTPNREVLRGTEDKGPPVYRPHVREFSSGEFYWVLKQYYEDVFLYHLPDVYVPWLEPMTILTKGTPIIADCRGPLA